MRRVLPARVAKLGELQPSRGRLLVLGRRIVSVLTIWTLQGNDLAHDTSSLVWPATSAGKQLVLQPESSLQPPDTPRRRVKVPATCIPEKLKRDSQAVRHTLVLLYYPRKPERVEVETPDLPSATAYGSIPPCGNGQNRS